MSRLTNQSPRETMLIKAPGRPKLRERATIQRAYSLFKDTFENTWENFDHDHLLHDLTEVIFGTADVWMLAHEMQLRKWTINHDIYVKLVDFWNMLEPSRRELEVEWVLTHGMRFPANEKDTVAFSMRGIRHVGEVVALDRPTARGFVEVKLDEKDIRTFAVEAEFVLMVQTNE